MKVSLFFTYVMAVCKSNDLGLGGIFPRSPTQDSPMVEETVDTSDTVVELPEETDIIPTPTPTVDYPPSETTVDTQGTTLYYCIPTVGAQEVVTPVNWYTTETIEVQGTATMWSTPVAQQTWPAQTTMVDSKLIYYCPPKETITLVNSLSTIYYTPPTIQETTTTGHTCEFTSTVNIQSASTCENSVQTLHMDVYKTIYVSSCVVTPEIFETDKDWNITTTTTTPAYVMTTTWY